MADDTNTGASQTPRGADLRTFLIADIRGYTRFTREQGDEAASALAARFAELVRGTVPVFEGELLELRGDEALCVFTSARQALRASVELQRRLRLPVGGEDAFPLGVGIGLDAGEAVPTEGGYRGSALNLAARLCGTAAGGHVVATERLVGLAGPVEGLHWSRSRAVRLKGVEDPQRVVEVEPDKALPPPPRPPSSSPRRRNRRIAGAALAVVFMVVLLVVVLVEHGGKTVAATVATPSHSVAVIDPTRDRVVADYRLGAAPESIVAGGETVWVGTAGNSVTPIDLHAHAARQPIGTCCDPAFMAYGDDALWTYDGLSHLVEIANQNVVATRSLWHCKPAGIALLTPGACGNAGGVVVVGDEVWVGRALNGDYSAHNGELVRVSASNIDRTLGIVPNMVTGVLATDGSTDVWSLRKFGGQINAASIADHEQIYGTLFPGQDDTFTQPALAVGLGYAWAGTSTRRLYANTTQGTLDLFTTNAGITALATTEDGLWVAQSNGVVELVTPSNGHLQLIHAYRFGHSDPVALTVVGRQVWVALA